jgi:gamma-glutamylcyclotransferase (GGCT)/AIG2-like uncharacterized protein YtfP
MLYFAYGSNLNASDLSRFCRERGLGDLGLDKVGPAFLPDRRLAFTHRSTTWGGGVLDIPPARGEAVAGILFRVANGAAMAALDRKEGEGHVYARFDTVALTEEGEEEPACAYQVAEPRRERFVPPAPSYLDVVRRGYEDHGLPVAPLNAAAAGGSTAGPIGGLFVYGTLRRGGERHPAIVRHKATGGEPVETTGTLLDLGLYPGLVLDGPQGRVAGELYIAGDRDALFAELDAIETFEGFGVPGSLYRRAIVRVRGHDWRDVLAWTYVYAGSREGSRVIASGDWNDRLAP